MHQKIQIFSIMRTQDSMHIVFVHPNQHGIECTSAELHPLNYSNLNMLMNIRPRLHLSSDSEKMAKASGKLTKTRNFSECEVEVLVSEVDSQKKILLGALSSGINNKRKDGVGKGGGGCYYGQVRAPQGK